MSTPSQALEHTPVSPVRPAIARRPGAWRFQIGRVTPCGVQLVAIGVIALALVALSYAMNHMSYIIWGAFWVAPVLLILSIPLANRAVRLDGEAIGRIILVAVTLKVLVAPLLRYWMAYGLYGGVADASRYHSAGAQLAPLFRQGIYGDLGHISGTRFLEILTGHVYALTGPTRLGGFVIFSWFAFLGLYLFYRAFRTAFPDGAGRRYLLLVFFFPTDFFWPSSIGKEAFMILALGCAAVGSAQLLAGRLRGLVWLAFGLLGSALVRPHMALIAGVGLAVAAPIALLRGSVQKEGRKRSRLGGAVLVLALLVSGPTLIGVTERFFGLESLNAQTAQELLDETTRRTGDLQSGSTFMGSSPNNPVGFASALVTVLFRPFPFEVRNTQAMLSSLEGLALIGLCVLGARRLGRIPLEMFRRPYVAFSVVYTCAFVYAFSSFVNFGLLARERSQLFPVLFVILCLPRACQEASSEGEADQPDRAAAIAV